MYRLWTFIIALVMCNTSFAENQDILEIRQEYKVIRSALPNLQEYSDTLLGFSAEGMDATIYKDKSGTIRLLKITAFGETGKLIAEYYYKGGDLIFAFKQSHRYNVPFYIDEERAKELGSESFDPKKTKITENRYYFKNGKLIRWLDNDKKRKSENSKEYKDEGMRILKNTNEIIKKMQE